MKWKLVWGFFFSLWFGIVAQAEEVTMAVTTSFHNSGLAAKLLPEIKKNIGLEVRLLVVGTGQALRLGERGDVDALLVHSRQREEVFINKGYGTHRREIMYNDFVFIGPRADPAKVAVKENAIEVLRAIDITRSPFVSRGDDSGTYLKERALWSAAHIQPEGAWYRAVGAGMGAALNTAAAMGAYLLSDRASWLNFGNRRDLILLYAGDPALFNQYAYIPIHPQRHPHVKYQAAKRLEQWLTGHRAKGIVDNYTIHGEALFHFNAKVVEP